ncbi:putative oxygen-independent coproporphyrinogen III oxidase [Rhodospirillaceae bacterium LM-1]|nr:putative oxygen-independent coproporphyrinogen III oxidase [Rhodospirillaceae bacterium LM-1]
MSRDPQLGVYIHWPWCLSKCPYCDFNSQAIDPKDIDQEGWRKSLLAELAHCLGATDRARIGSVFFGGGTPSLIDPASIAAILELLSKHRPISKQLEVTLEANPGTIDAKRLDHFRQAGVNRVSLGMQALDDQALKQLGRSHDTKAALKALDLIRKRFERVSIDLIYGRPGQSLNSWQDELTKALGLGLDHYSLYQLTYESSTPLGRAALEGRIKPLDGDSEADFFAMTQDQMGAAIRCAYEISNYASKSAYCRHNLDIWRGGTYLGVGPGAHGREPRDGQIHATERLADPLAWAKQVAAKGHGYKTCEPLLPGERAQELILLGLRLTEGIDRARFARQSGFDLAEVINPLAVQRMAADGYIQQDCTSLRTTPQGRQLLDSVVRILLSESL